MKGDRTFIDTNIIIYAYDNSAGEKQKKASGILAGLWESGNGLISSQVLEELFVNITRKIPNPLPVKEARSLVRDLSTWPTVIIDGALVIDAIDISIKHRLSFWDSLIIASASKSGASILYSEDLGHKMTIEGVTVINPFVKATHM